MKHWTVTPPVAAQFVLVRMRTTAGSRTAKKTEAPPARSVAAVAVEEAAAEMLVIRIQAAGTEGVVAHQTRLVTSICLRPILSRSVIYGGTAEVSRLVPAVTPGEVAPAAVAASVMVMVTAAVLVGVGVIGLGVEPRQ